LRLDYVAVAKKLLDAQVLLDPFEKQFHLPAAFVQHSDGQGWQACVVGQEDQSLLSFGIFEPDTTQVFGVVLGDLVPTQCNGLIADDAAFPVHFGRVNAPGIYVAFGAVYKEGAGLMHLKQASKVDVASVHHVELTQLQVQDVQQIDPVHLTVADVDEGGNRAPEVQQCVQLDGCDREIMRWVATTKAIDAGLVGDLMMQAVEKRFGLNGKPPHTIEWLTENCSCYTAEET